MKTRAITEPNTPPLTWQQFCDTAPPGSVAIDGYVTGPQMWHPKKRILNLNHHEGCERLSTRCTAAQAVILIRSGLLRAFEGIDEMRIYRNDCDQDVILTSYALQNAFVVKAIVSPIFNRILHIADMLDTTAGAYAFPADMPGMEESNWIFQPYTLARLNGTLARRDPREFDSVIESSCDRISRSLAGRGEKLPLDTRYEKVGSGTGWILVRETGLNARVGVFNDADAFVAFRERPNGNLDVSIGRRSLFISDYDVPEICNRLNLAEGTPDDPWGGGETIMGSPRSTGTKLTIEQVTHIVESVVMSKQPR